MTTLEFGSTIGFLFSSSHPPKQHEQNTKKDEKDKRKRITILAGRDNITSDCFANSSIIVWYH
jgi:hypothetical protein